MQYPAFQQTCLIRRVFTKRATRAVFLTMIGIIDEGFEVPIGKQIIFQVFQAELFVAVHCLLAATFSIAPSRRCYF